MRNMNDRKNSGASHTVERSGEVARLKEGTRATMAELQEFLGEARGKSPQEVLGLVAASGLAQGIALSTLATAFVLLVFTAVPYFVYGDAMAVEAEKKKAAAAAAAAEQAAQEEAAAQAATTAEAEDAKQDKKAAAVKAMTKEFDESKGAGDAMPDIDDLLK